MESLFDHIAQACVKAHNRGFTFQRGSWGINPENGRLVISKDRVICPMAAVILGRTKITSKIAQLKAAAPVEDTLLSESAAKNLGWEEDWVNRFIWVYDDERLFEPEPDGVEHVACEIRRFCKLLNGLKTRRLTYAQALERFVKFWAIS